MVDAAATMAMETLRDLLIEEVKFLSGVEDQVEDVGRELQAMRRFLKDADRYNSNSDIVRGWVSELIDLATRAEDVLEKYAVQVASKRGAMNLKKRLKRFTCILGECLSLHEIGNETASIMSRMSQLTKNLESITSNGDGPSSTEDQRLLRQTYGHGIEEHFVGMESDIALLVSRIKNTDDRPSRVASICGMGGLGKTTLARRIYQDKAILFCFEARAWVCVTQKLQAKAVFQEILRQLLPGENDERVMRMEEAELVRELYEIQKVKRCLVVLDDIWEMDHWDILKKAFPLAESDSKILITTRNQMIADTEFAYKLGCLTEDESWDLLQKIALPIHESQANSKQFEDIGRELIRKCGCLPLAVSVIGGILRGQQNLGDWKKVHENMDSYLKHGKGVYAIDKRVEQVLNLSYNVLPYYLKLCFLYLGCFPEGKDIYVEDVYLIWMAEGLISSDDKGRNETLWDVAERYLNELASKCMVQVKLTTWSFKTCRLHDLVRDLCLSKGIEEEFLKVMDSQKQYGSTHGRIRRLAINLVADSACSVAQFKNANLRSLILLSRGPHDITNIWQNLLGNAVLRSLKVLILECCKFEDDKLPHAVRELVMLKHLSIRHISIVEVPKFICKLPCLQSLDLRALSVLTLPNVIYQMGRMRHLFLIRNGTMKIDGGRLRLDGLTELETLIGFHSQFFDSNHLLKLTNLRHIGGIVDDIESFSVVVNHITRLKDQLREASLEIYVKDLASEECSLLMDSLMHSPLSYLKMDGRLRRLPTWDPELLQNLNTLILYGCEIREDPMETLQHLPTLRSLQLGWKSFLGTEMICKSKGFPQLKSLTLASLTDLLRWGVEREAMPNLSHLSIYRCSNLTMIPEGIASMASITNLKITSMPRSFIDQLIQEDYHKISHIPFIHLGIPDGRRRRWRQTPPSQNPPSAA